MGPTTAPNSDLPALTSDGVHAGVALDDGSALLDLMEDLDGSDQPTM